MLCLKKTRQKIIYLEKKERKDLSEEIGHVQDDMRASEQNKISGLKQEIAKSNKELITKSTNLNL